MIFTHDVKHFKKIKGAADINGPKTVNVKTAFTHLNDKFQVTNLKSIIIPLRLLCSEWNLLLQPTCNINKLVTNISHRQEFLAAL